MNRTIFSLLVLLLLGLFSQPVTAQRSPQQAQLEAEKGVAKMSEKEMRALLPTLKARYEELRNIIKTGNYSQLGNDGLSEAFSKADIADEYICVTADINAIEKRLSKIDSQKPKPQTEQQLQEETDQKQQEEFELELEKQRQAEFQQFFKKHLEKSEGRYNQRQKDVYANANAARIGNVALNLVRGNKDPNFKSISDDMWAKQQSPRSNSQPNISGKFNKPKSEEPKKEEPEETFDVVAPDEPKEEVSEEDDAERRRKLIKKLQSL